MIATLLRVGFINLRRDRVAQMLTFVLPILFFSIFATIFANQRDTTRRVRVAVVDLDGSEYSRQLVKALQAEGGLRIQTSTDESQGSRPLDRAAAEALVKAGTVPVAVVLPKGLGSTRRFFNADQTAAPRVQLLADVSDPVAPQMVLGLLQKVSFTAMPESFASEGMASAFGLATETVNVMQPVDNRYGIVSFYAAGTGVMFLLFSCAGAGGALLDEQESGTLGRLLSSKAGMRGVLLGKWLFIAVMGILQLSVMFIWGALVFHLPLLPHLPGFLVMTTITAAAAAGFGLLLATISHSRAQLSGISTIVILTMSAVGGSMFPRFLMSETMQSFGLVTFNAWALDGYLKVFWRSAPLLELWPQVAVLGGLTITFLAAARVVARRWETL